MSRGGFLHNTVLIAPAQRLALAARATVRLEYATTQPRGAIDLLIDTKRRRIAWEAELRPDRVRGDVAKAASAGAVVLLIVSPAAATSRACARVLAGLVLPANLTVFVLPIGPALGHLRRLLP